VGSELIFKVILIAEYSIFSVIRIRNQRSVQKADYRTVIEESKKYSTLLALLICYEVLTLFLYLLYPESIIWAAVSMPLLLRWLGVIFGLLALLLFAWVHRNLGENFSIKLKIKDKQNLVVTGPYRWVRHPMYTAFYLLHIAAFFLTANWFIGVTWLIGLSIIVVSKVKREEAMLLEIFGDEYSAYMERTGRLIPLLKRPPFYRETKNSGKSSTY
jgi:protein-S-isoprenylcysteine O-methyltransferase Ste14